MTLNRPRSRSRNFGIKYLENGERYDVGLKGGQIGNRPSAFDWHHDLWPWMTLNRPSSRSLKLQSNILITVYGMQQRFADSRFIERRPISRCKRVTAYRLMTNTTSLQTVVIKVGVPIEKRFNLNYAQV